MKAATYKDLQNNLDHYVEDVVDNQEPLMVPDKGVVILSLEDYESTAETLYLLRSSEMRRAIDEAHEELSNGGGVKVNLNELWN